ncbi:MAG: Gp15 family bacteriophage protein [Spirochaetia bacterium]|nr:Gp15 family bacteriophage protein [Spirochaetia bacterium]
MIDLSRAFLPDSVTVEGRSFLIHTDFRFWINFVRRVKNIEEQTYEDFDFLFDGELPENKKEAFEALCRFAFPVSELPRKTDSEKSDVIPYDFDLDADYIFAAFYQQYRIDLCDDKLRLHWYKFMALFNGLKDTKFDDIVGWRFFVPGEKHDAEKEKLKLRQKWEIKHTLTKKEKETIENFRKHLKC